MRVLLTGDRGLIGRAVTARLARAGHQVAGFDLARGEDLRDLDAVRAASRGCDAVVHLGAIPHDDAGSPADIMAVNVLGTWHVLLAAEAERVSRVIHFSSGQVLGIAEGEQLPEAYPIDDSQPRRAMRPYGVSKRLGEDLCESWSRRTGIPTLSLRPVAVRDDAMQAAFEARWQADPTAEGEPFWEYGAWVHLDDVAEATVRSLEVALSGHDAVLLCSEQISGSGPSLELAGHFTPTVPIRDWARYAAHPRAALMDCSAARALLGWTPQH